MAAAAAAVSESAPVVVHQVHVLCAVVGTASGACVRHCLWLWLHQLCCQQLRHFDAQAAAAEAVAALAECGACRAWDVERPHL